MIWKINWGTFEGVRKMYIVPLSGLENIQSIQSKDIPESSAGLGAGLPFKQLLQEAVQNLSEVQETNIQDTYDLATGSVSDLYELSIHSAMQQTAVEMTVQLASRAVSAYKEVLQMQI